MRPPLVYLDSKDFIQLTDERDNPEIQEVWKYLTENTRRGRCLLGYSYVHIVEVLNPNSPEHMESQKAYGETIHELCQGAFPFPHDLMSGHRFPNDFIWGPRSILDDFGKITSRKEIRKIIQSEIKKTGLPRKERRELNRKIRIEELVRKADYDVPASLQRFGVSKTDLKKLILNPEKHRRTFFHHINRMASDPRYYSEAINSIRPGENPFLHEVSKVSCSIPDDHISPLRSALFMARSVLREVRDGTRPC